MPHSSGGGSHGGGSHHSSSSHSSSHRSSSGGGSSRIRTSHTYFPGARRFVYYRNGVPNYVYSDTDLSKGPSKLRFLMLIFYVPFVLAAFLMIFTSFGVPEKLKVDYNSQIVIQDDANVLGDTTKLGDALEDFFNTTGISPAVMTVYNSDWEDNYTDLEKYAYELYVNRFYDEKHWLIVYSQPKDPDDEFNNWYWEGMQGDDTDSIITSSVAYDFTNDLHKRLLVEGTKVNDAITDSFNALTPTVMKFRFEGETFGIGLFMLLFVCVHAFFMVFFRPDAKKYKGAKEVPLDDNYVAPQQTAPQPQSVVMKQASCEYCGGVYTIGSCNACPHCGAPIQPQDYTVPVHNGTSTASTTDTTNTNTH